MNNVVMGLLYIGPVIDPDIKRQNYTYKVTLRPFRRPQLTSNHLIVTLKLLKGGLYSPCNQGFV